MDCILEMWIYAGFLIEDYSVLVRKLNNDERKFALKYALAARAVSNEFIARLQELGSPDDATPARERISGALWLWGRLRDFEREAPLDRSPCDLFETMTPPMRADVVRLAPIVSAWLRRVEEG